MLFDVAMVNGNRQGTSAEQADREQFSSILAIKLFDLSRCASPHVEGKMAKYFPRGGPGAAWLDGWEAKELIMRPIGETTYVILSHTFCYLGIQNATSVLVKLRAPSFLQSARRSAHVHDNRKTKLVTIEG